MFKDIFADINLSDVLLKGVGPVVGVILVWWKGGFRWLFSVGRRQLALRRYRKALRADVSNVPIIGKKEGFDLTKVYVRIDTSPSDLMSATPEQRRQPPPVFVLVGSPGGGKSTYVKNQLLDSLQESRNRMPLFFRLRDFDKKYSIEELIVRRVEGMGIKNAGELVKAELRSGNLFCVLDGLDEVRPNLIQDAHDAINAFYATYFLGKIGHRLIVTCRKEAYRTLPLSIPAIWEVLPLKDAQIQQFAKNWPLTYPHRRTPADFWADLSASEKILEVSRSPLLLVGGLLLYTESGLGIPGHRIKYLERIKQTLIEDWAVAQGQPPDALRDAYTPVLTAVALKMHQREPPELARDECLKILEEVLPTVGHQSSTAPEFLDSIFRRTGILVRDTPGFVVFVQFTLQEYFASLAMMSKLQPDEIAALEPKTWWREAILFVAAQTTDPSKLIDALLGTSPMIGALAVAETPTPSLRLQRDAIDRSLEHLDAGDGAAIPALVALMRKVSQPLAAELAATLEERVEQESELVAENASLILASAGTEMATEALSRHPRSWQHCLKNPRLMSGKFEAKLAEWVEVPDHPHWTEAADLLVQLPSIQEAGRLGTLLEHLPAGRSADFAIKTLVQLHSQEDGSPWREPGTNECAALCAAISYVDDVERALTAVSVPADPDGTVSPLRGTGLVPASLTLLKSRKWSGATAGDKMFRTLRDGSMFAHSGSQYLAIFASSLVPLGMSGLFGLSGAAITAFCVTFILNISISIPSRPNPWMSVRYTSFAIRRIMHGILISLFVMVAVISFHASNDHIDTVHLPSLHFLIQATCCAALCAMMFRFPSRMFMHESSASINASYHRTHLSLATSSWNAYLVAALFVAIIFRKENSPLLLYITLAVSGLVLLWSGERLIAMFRSYRLVRRAANEVSGQ